jgi:hypothetical protein
MGLKVKDSQSCSMANLTSFDSLGTLAGFLETPLVHLGDSARAPGATAAGGGAIFKLLEG